MDKQSFHDQFAVLFLHLSDMSLLATIGMLEEVIDRADLISFALTSKEKPEVVWSRVRDAVAELQKVGRLPLIIVDRDLDMNEITPELVGIISDYPQGGIMFTEVPFLRGWDTLIREQKNWDTAYFNGYNLNKKCEEFLFERQEREEFKNA